MLKNGTASIGPIGLLILCAAVLMGIVHCDAPPETTTNPVRSIEIKDLEKIIAGENYTGLVTVVAAWCAPCREELPVLADLHRKYGTAGIRIIAVGIDNGGPKEIQPLVNKLNVPFPVYWAGPAAIQHYKIIGIPTLLVVNGGRISEKLFGLHSRREIEKKIKALLR